MLARFEYPWVLDEETSEMATETKTIEINAQVFELACRGAALDQVDVARYLECIVMRDADYIRTREFLEGTPGRVERKKEDARLAA